MSMINDALKRVQKQSPSAAPGPQLRPAEPSQLANRALVLVVPALLVFAVLIGAFFLWQALQNPQRNPEPVRAKTIAPEIPAPKVVQQPAPQPVHPVQLASVSAPKPRVMAPKPAPVAAPASTPEKLAASTPAPAPAPVVAAPPSTPVKLQAIFYAPGHSTAMINGKTVQVGDALKEYRIVAITQTSVRLISFTRTNVLTLVGQ